MRRFNVKLKEVDLGRKEPKIEVSTTLNGYQWTSLPELTRQELEYLRDQIDNYLSVTNPINKES